MPFDWALYLIIFIPFLALFLYPWSYLNLQSMITLTIELLIKNIFFLRAGIPPFTCARSVFEKLKIKQEEGITKVVTCICLHLYHQLSLLFLITNSRFEFES